MTWMQISSGEVCQWKFYKKNYSTRSFSSYIKGKLQITLYFITLYTILDTILSTNEALINLAINPTWTGGLPPEGFG